MGAVLRPNKNLSEIIFVLFAENFRRLSRMDSFRRHTAKSPLGGGLTHLAGDKWYEVASDIHWVVRLHPLSPALDVA
jgi:hypothetical protein